MISRKNVQVFGKVALATKERIYRIKAKHPQISESHLIELGLLKILPDFEELSRNHHGPRRSKHSA